MVGALVSSSPSIGGRWRWRTSSRQRGIWRPQAQSTVEHAHGSVGWNGAPPPPPPPPPAAAADVRNGLTVVRLLPEDCEDDAVSAARRWSYSCFPMNPISKRSSRFALSSIVVVFWFGGPTRKEEVFARFFRSNSNVRETEIHFIWRHSSFLPPICNIVRVKLFREKGLISEISQFGKNLYLCRKGTNSLFFQLSMFLQNSAFI